MTQFKIIIHCDQFNAVLVEEWESRDAALDHYAGLLNKPSLLRFGEVLVNTARITFVQAQEVVAEPVAESETIEIVNETP
jgi:quinol monooxygenase YgiN